MNLYLITRPSHRPPDWEEWKAAIVAAASEDDARLIHPGGHPTGWHEREGQYEHGWIFPRDVVVTLIGTAAPGVERGVVLGSNAGA